MLHSCCEKSCSGTPRCWWPTRCSSALPRLPIRKPERVDADAHDHLLHVLLMLSESPSPRRAPEEERARLRRLISLGAGDQPGESLAAMGHGKDEPGRPPPAPNLWVCSLEPYSVWT
mmetsp:Transcript_10699/g.23571  ORF Transcript_10699/g.23571 Transcript_10699/m.23571 type:complete len:117 (+) Transcript_10699:150-500(+)